MKINMKMLAVLLCFFTSFSLYGQMEYMWVCGTGSEADTSGGGSSSGPTGTIPMTDDFSSSSIDANKWLTGTNSGNLSSIVNGELNLKSSGSGQAGWVITDKSYAPRNSTVTIKVSQANDDGNLAISPTYDLSSPTGIYNQNNYYQFYTYRSGGTGSYQLYAQWKKNGTLGDQNITGSLNITGTVWLRLRFDNTTIYFEASLDGSTWSTQYSETFNLPGYTLDDAFHYQLCAYNTPSKGEWLCDDFAIESTSGGGTTEVTLLSDDFSSGSIDTDTWYIGTNSGNQSAISSGELNLKSSGSGQSGWVITKDAFTAENTTVTVKVTQPNDDGNLAISPTYDLSSPTGIYNQNNYYQFYTYRSGGTGSYQLYAQWKKNGTLADQNITGSLNITGTVWLRFRFDDTTIYFEASLDSTTWYTQYSETFDLPGYDLNDTFRYQLCAYNTPTKGEWLCDDFSIVEFTEPAAKRNRVTHIMPPDLLAKANGFGYDQIAKFDTSASEYKMAVLYFKPSDDDWLAPPENDFVNEVPLWDPDSAAPSWKGQLLIPTSRANTENLDDAVAEYPLSITAYFYRMSNKKIWVYGPEITCDTTLNKASSKTGWQNVNKGVLKWFIDHYNLGSAGLNLDNDGDGNVDLIAMVCRSRLPLTFQGNSGSEIMPVAEITGASGEPKIKRGDYPVQSVVYGRDVYSLYWRNLIFHEIGHHIFGFVHHNRMGKWSLMHGAPRGKVGWTMSSWERKESGWLAYDDVTTDVKNYHLGSLTKTDEALLIPYPGTKGFVIEHRINEANFEKTPKAGDASEWTPLAEGLLIGSYSSSSGNPTIKSAANNTIIYDGDATDLFVPGVKDKITPYTTPNTNIGSTVTHLAITNIHYSANGEEMIFDIYRNYWGSTLPTGTTTWTKAESPYYIGEDLTIGTGSVLLIKPGTVVKLAKDVQILVQGTGNISADGSTTTLTEEIEFIRAESNEKWNSIVLQSNDNYFENCKFNGGHNNLLISGTNNVIRNCTFENAVNGIYCNSYSEAYIRNCEFAYNAYGINCYNYAEIDLTGNRFYSNTTAGVKSSFSCVLKLFGNVIEDNQGDGLVAELSDVIYIGNPYNWDGYNTISNNGGYEVKGSYGNPNIDFFSASIHDNTDCEIYTNSTESFYALSSWFGSDGPSLCGSGSFTNAYPLSAVPSSWDGNTNSNDTYVTKRSAIAQNEKPDKFRGKEGVESLMAKFKDAKTKDEDALNAMDDLYAMIRADFKKDKMGKKDKFETFLEKDAKKHKSKKIAKRADWYHIIWQGLKKEHPEAIANTLAFLEDKPEDTFGPRVNLVMLYLLNHNGMKAETLLHELLQEYGEDNALLQNLKVEIKLDRSANDDGFTPFQDSSAESSSEDEPMVQNYPNPFNPVTKIRYNVSEENRVKISVFNIRGQLIKNLVNERQPVGIYEVPFDGKNLPSGIYFYMIKIGDKIKTRRMTLLK